MMGEVDANVAITKDGVLTTVLEAAEDQDQTITLATAILHSIILSIMILMQQLMLRLLAIG
jgi:hypothetical protein